MTASGDGVSLVSNKKYFENRQWWWLYNFVNILKKKNPLNCTHFSFAVLHGLWDPSSPTKDLNPSPQQLQCRIPTTGPTGNTLYTFIFLATLGLCCNVWVLHCMWDLNSLTRDWTHVPCIRRQILNHWTTREVPPCLL